MNIQESIRRVLNEEYILYHMGHYNLIVPGRVDGSLQNVFEKSRTSMADNALDTQVQAVVTAMKAQGKKAATSLEILDALENGALLEQLLEGIAGALDDGIQQAWSQQVNGSTPGQAFSQSLNAAYSYAGMFEHGKAEMSQVQSFFDLVIQAMQTVAHGALPQSIFFQLTDIGKQMSSNNFSYQGNTNVSTLVTKEQLDAAQRVVNYLAKAASKLSAEGAINTDSFRTTIINIFGTAMGEEIGRQMLESAMPNLDQEIVSISNQVLKGNGNIKLTSANFSLAGSDKIKETNKTGKVDLLNSQALSLSLSMNGATTTIDIATNVSVKWYKSNKKGVIPHVSLGSLKMGNLLNSELFDTATRGIAYNIIGHNWVNTQDMKKLRSTLAASFVDQWISGSGGLTTEGNVDKTQFFLINGKLYSIVAIIRKIMETIPYGTKGGPVSVSFGGITKKTNSWEPMQPGEDPWDSAERRSRRVQGIINGLTVSATLNMNVLGLTGRYV